MSRDEDFSPSVLVLFRLAGAALATDNEPLRANKIADLKQRARYLRQVDKELKTPFPTYAAMQILINDTEVMIGRSTPVASVEISNDALETIVVN